MSPDSHLDLRILEIDGHYANLITTNSEGYEGRLFTSHLGLLIKNAIDSM